MPDLCMQGTSTYQPGSVRALQGLQKSHQWGCLSTTGRKGRHGRRLHQFAAVHVVSLPVSHSPLSGSSLQGIVLSVLLPARLQGARPLLEQRPLRRAVAWGQQLGCGRLLLQRLPGRCQAWKDRRRGVNEVPPPLFGGRSDVYEESDT